MIEREPTLREHRPVGVSYSRIGPLTPRLEPFHYEVAEEFTPEVHKPGAVPRPEVIRDHAHGSPRVAVTLASGGLEDDIRRLNRVVELGADPVVPAWRDRTMLRRLSSATADAAQAAGREARLMSDRAAGPEEAVLLAEAGAAGLTLGHGLWVDLAETASILAAAGMIGTIVPEEGLDPAEALAFAGMMAALCEAAGMEASRVCVTAPGLDLPGLLALRSLFDRQCVQVRVHPATPPSSPRDAAVAPVLNQLAAHVAGADMLAVHTPDDQPGEEIRALQTALQTQNDLREVLLCVRPDVQGEMADRVRTMIERAVSALEALADPVAGTVMVPRDPDYFAPVCAHYGQSTEAAARDLGLPPGSGPVGVSGGFGSRFPVSAGEGYAALGRLAVSPRDRQMEREAASLPAGRLVDRRSCWIIHGCTLCEPAKGTA